jgi:hypothetical protein
VAQVLLQRWRLLLVLAAFVYFPEGASTATDAQMMSASNGSLLVSKSLFCHTILSKMSATFGIIL